MAKQQNIAKVLILLTIFATFFEFKAMNINSISIDLDKEKGDEKDNDPGNLQTINLFIQNSHDGKK